MPKKRSLVVLLALFVLITLITGCDDDDRRRRRDHAHKPRHEQGHKPPPRHDGDHRWEYDGDHKPSYSPHSPEAAVSSFVAEVKNNNLKEAAAYVSPDSKKNTSLSKVQAEIKQLQAADLVAVKQVEVQDNYAVVQATLQEPDDSRRYTTKPVGLERIDDDWYIVHDDRIYHNDKYSVLRKMLQNN